MSTPFEDIDVALSVGIASAGLVVILIILTAAWIFAERFYMPIVPQFQYVPEGIVLEEDPVSAVAESLPRLDQLRPSTVEE